MNACADHRHCGRAFLNAMQFSFFQIAAVRRSRKRAGFNKQAARCAPGARFGVERPMTAPQPMLSVILPNYNHGTYIARALNSYLTQKTLPDEVIIVDDGSQDSSVEIIRDYSERHACIRPLYN